MQINCLNFSDTVVFWTNEDSLEALKEILAVTYIFNWQANDYFFPVRGTLLYGDIFHVAHSQLSDGGGFYNINSIYGSGIIAAHLKAESQDWAGTVIDQSVISKIRSMGEKEEILLDPYCKKYLVPYKAGTHLKVDEEEYVFRLIKGYLDEVSFTNMSNNIAENFARYNKDISPASVQRKLTNTLEYLRSFIPLEE